VALVALARGRTWARLPLLLAAWLGAIVLVLARPSAATWLMNLNSAYIVFFVPLALLLSVVMSRVFRRLAKSRGARPFALAALTFLLALAFLFGARQQTNILNAETILALPADVAALEWVNGALPADAFVAVNAWQWLGFTWAGSDGGAWLLPLTGRATTTPPVDYIHDPVLAQEVNAFNRAAQQTPDWSDPASAVWLRSQGISHLFVGARGGYFDPAELSRNPDLCTLYARDGAFVFGWREGEPPCLP
jgi:hypothetical protein